MRGDRIGVLEMTIPGRQRTTIAQVHPALRIDGTNDGHVAIGHFVPAILVIGLKQDLITRSDFKLMALENTERTGLLTGERHFTVLFRSANDPRSFGSQDGDRFIPA